LILEIGREFADFIRIHKLRKEDDTETLEEIMNNISEKFKLGLSEKNDAAYKLEILKQEDGQTVQQFYARMRELAAIAGIDNEGMLKMKFLGKIKDQEFATFPLVLSEYSLDKCVQEVEVREERKRKEKEEPTTSANVLKRDAENEKTVHSLRYSGGKMNFKSNQNKNDLRNRLKRAYGELDDSQKCDKCNNEKHGRGEACPAKDAKCFACGESGHYSRAKSCKKRKKKNDKTWKKIYAVWKRTENDLVDRKEKFLIDSVVCTALIDSGSPINIIARDTWEILHEKFEYDEVCLYDINYAPKGDQGYRGVGGSMLKAMVKFKAWLQPIDSRKPKIFAEFFVFQNVNQTIIGSGDAGRTHMLKTGFEVSAEKAQTISRIEAENLKELNAVPGDPVVFEVDKSVTPTQRPYFNVAFAWEQKAMDRLKVWETLGIIEEIHHSPKWISGISAVEKGKNDFRLIIDMRGPNKAVKRQFHKIPTFENLRMKVAGAKYFSTLDLENAYYHFMLAPECRDLTAFAAGNKLYRFVRLPQGMNASPEIFQSKLERLLNHLPGCANYIDDIIIWGKTKEEVKRNEDLVREELKKYNFIIKESKTESCKESVEFIGHTFSERGVRISDKRIQVFKDLVMPNDCEEMRSFLGMAGYNEKFIKNFATITAPLREAIGKRGGCKGMAKMTKKSKSEMKKRQQERAQQAKDGGKVETSMKWTDEEIAAFERVKKAIVKSILVLGFFDNNARTILFTDASPKGLGAVLVQEQDGEERIISCASRSLTAAEKKYPQTQREALGIVFGIEYFRYYLQGEWKMKFICE
jgi:hypothetical protein